MYLPQKICSWFRQIHAIICSSQILMYCKMETTTSTVTLACIMDINCCLGEYDHFRHITSYLCTYRYTWTNAMCSLCDCFCQSSLTSNAYCVLIYVFTHLDFTITSFPSHQTFKSKKNLSCNDQNLRQSELKTFRKFWRLWDWFEFVSHQLVAKWWTWKGEAHGDSADNLVNKLLQIFLGGCGIFLLLLTQ